MATLTEGDRVHVVVKHHGRMAPPRMVHYSGSIARIWSGDNTTYIVVALNPSGRKLRTFDARDITAIA